uniref:Uncharacterized protein n=1 Tax=Clytia hemisphaerica TaxID=252671 RepID=A0A7M5UXX9_9CNID
SFQTSANISGGCTLLFNENYNIIDLQIKQPNVQDWVKVSESSHIKNRMIEVLKLPFGSHHEFRGLAETQDNKIICLNSQQSVTIREIKGYDDANLEQDNFQTSANISGGCTLLFNENYNIIDLQIKQPNVQGWVKVSESSHIKNGMIEVLKLPFGSHHEFRGLAETQDNKIICLNSQQSVTIREIKPGEKIVIKHQNCFVHDFP